MIYTATVNSKTVVDNYGEPLTINFGLEPSRNYYLGTPSGPIRDNFVSVSGPGALVDELDVAIAGRVDATVNATILGGLGYAKVRLKIPNINNVIQKNKGAVAVVYEAKIEAGLPSFIDLLLLDPNSIINAVGNVFDQAEKYSLGSEGVLSKLNVPIAKSAVSKGMNATKPENPVSKAKRNVVGEIDSTLKREQKNDGERRRRLQGSSETVADILADVLEDVLDSVGILDKECPEGVTVEYYVHGADGRTGHPAFSDDIRDDVKSLMWTIPFGESDS